MKLERGIIEDIHELTGYSRPYIHMIIKGEREQNTLGGKKILKVIEILSTEKIKSKEKIKKALIEIENSHK